MLVLVFVEFFVVFLVLLFVVLFGNLMAIIAIGMRPDCVFMVMLTSKYQFSNGDPHTHKQAVQDILLLPANLTFGPHQKHTQLIEHRQTCQKGICRGELRRRIGKHN